MISKLMGNGIDEGGRRACAKAEIRASMAHLGTEMLG